MEHIQLYSGQDNIVGFGLQSKGLNENEPMKVFFVIETELCDLRFDCVKEDTGEYIVNIPEIPFAKNGRSYSCAVEVVANHFFFIALKLTATVTKKPNVEATVLQPKSLKQSAPAEKPESKAVVHETSTETPVVSDEKAQPVQETDSKIEKIEAILAEIGMPITKTKKPAGPVKRRITLKH